jgi:hypothetical protein
MFDKIGRLAEKAADSISVSRRGFLGRLGRGAMVVGALLAGFSTAAGQSGGVMCCSYGCRIGGRYHRYSLKFKCQAAGTTCGNLMGNCPLLGWNTLTDCTVCGK